MKDRKKLMNLAIVYLILGMVAGVFYREFTKFNDFTGRTVLGVLHTHVFVLGAALFLMIAIVSKVTNVTNNTMYKKFMVIYNIAFPFVIGTMLIRGILQVLGTELSKSMNAMLSGFAGLSHIGIGVALVFLVLAFKQELCTES